MGCSSVLCELANHNDDLGYFSYDADMDDFKVDHNASGHVTLSLPRISVDNESGRVVTPGFTIRDNGEKGGFVVIDGRR